LLIFYFASSRYQNHKNSAAKEEAKQITSFEAALVKISRKLPYAPWGQIGLLDVAKMTRSIGSD